MENGQNLDQASVPSGENTEGFDLPEQFVSKALIAMVIGFLLFLVFCGGMIFPVQFVFYLVTGWCFYLSRVIPQVRLNYPEIVLGVCVALLFAFVLHCFVKTALKKSERFAAMKWKATLSICASMLLGVGFVLGFAMIGSAQQIGWFFTTKDHLISESFFCSPGIRSSSKNNLKQQGLSVHNYFDTHNTFPLSPIVDKRGKGMHSWFSRILPMMEHAPLYEEIDFTLPWDAEENELVFQTEIGVLQTPAHRKRDEMKKDLQTGYFYSHYAANSHLNRGEQGLRFEEVTDGTSVTILGGEVKSNLSPWGKPGHFRDPGLGINSHPDGFGGPYKGGSLFMFVDGSVRFLSDEIDPEVLKKMSTPSGGEEMPEEY